MNGHTHTSEGVPSRRAVLSGIGAAGLAGVAGCLGGGGSGTTLDFYTSTEATSAYQMGQGVAAVLDDSDEVNVDAYPSEGAEQSMALLDQGEADIAIGDAINLYEIDNDLNLYEENPFDNQIYQLHSYYTVNLNLVGTMGNVEDVTGLDENLTIFPTFAGGTSRRHLLRHLSHALPYDADEFEDEFDLVDMTFDEMAGALETGRADVVSDTRINVGDVIGSYQQDVYSRNDDAYILNWPDDIQSNVDDDPMINGAYYTADEIGDYGYHGREEIWWTQQDFLVCTNETVDDDTVYDYLTALWESREDLGEYHALLEHWTEGDYWTGYINPDVPIHPEAERFYEEQDITLP